MPQLRVPSQGGLSASGRGLRHYLALAAMAGGWHGVGRPASNRAETGRNRRPIKASRRKPPTALVLIWARGMPMQKGSRLSGRMRLFRRAPITIRREEEETTSRALGRDHGCLCSQRSWEQGCTARVASSPVAPVPSVDDGPGPPPARETPIDLLLFVGRPSHTRCSAADGRDWPDGDAVLAYQVAGRPSSAAGLFMVHCCPAKAAASSCRTS
ncbi:hypothetical protein QBC34DRAFT_108010 [Podospora aff. communis PSN243]|uniref:Uncharacterized protein n=1 Tax=Podospora aff. communis PSN243 TaxID=3040156 RepID=A0AAV9H5A6_9PEZI|nr:hypothetical protein QBC34DRAFT_108010 [Podospora aff. communis PSN243]